jgi:uncharacterized protein (DUF362 family)
MITRRDFLRASATVPLLGTPVACSKSPRWESAAVRRQPESRVAILPAASYAVPLAQTVQEGLKLCAPPVQGRRVVLKPNLVEFDAAAPINTHPAVVSAAIDAFRALGAREVVVAEGPGHRRDTEQILIASGLYDVLRERRVPFVDLNDDEVTRLALRSDFTSLKQLYLPNTVVKSGLLVSMPKLKMHHWAGVTLSLKNMFGIVPGSVYGWPKNLLHWAGIHHSIVDINSTLPVPTFAIVDGIVGMEGNGPIQGTARTSGVLIFGQDLVAVDATAARVMRIDPTRVPHVANAGQFLGNVAADRIAQVGLRIDAVAQDFAVIEAMRPLKQG